MGEAVARAARERSEQEREAMGSTAGGVPIGAPSHAGPVRVRPPGDHCGITAGSLRDHCGITAGSLRDRPEITAGSRRQDRGTQSPVDALMHGHERSGGVDQRPRTGAVVASVHEMDTASGLNCL